MPDIRSIEKRFFSYCSRTTITLSGSLAISDDKAMYRTMEVKEYSGACSTTAYGRRHVSETDRPSSPAFVLFKDHLWDGGPGLLCVFGMGGPQSLLINYL